MIIGVVGTKGSGKSTTAGMISRLLTHRGLVVTELAFADPLKHFCKEVFDFSDEALWGESDLRDQPDTRYPHPLPDGYGWVMVGWWPWVFTNDGPHPKMEELINKLTVGNELGPHESIEALKKRIQGTLFGYVTPREALQKLGTEWGRDLYREVWIDLGIRKARSLIESGGTDIVVVTDCRFINEAEAIRRNDGVILKLVRDQADSAARQHRSESEQANIPADRLVLNNGNLGELWSSIRFALDGLRARAPNAKLREKLAVFAADSSQRGGEKG